MVGSKVEKSVPPDDMSYSMINHVSYYNCVIRPEQRSNKGLKGQDGKSLLRLKRGFRPLSAFEPSGSLYDMYIRVGVFLRLESITSHHQQHTGHLIRMGCLVQLVQTQPKTYHSA